MFFFIACPVLLFCVGCGDASPVEQYAETFQSFESAISGPLYNVIIPDSLNSAIVWRGNTPLTVSFLAEDSVQSGDTVLVGTEPFFSVEKERLEMALNIAEATGDSVIADSLFALLADSSGFIAVVSDFTGRIAAVIRTGDTLQPGDTVAVVTGPPPDSIYYLIPVYQHIKWPENLPGYTVTSRGLLCSGFPPDQPVSLPGTYSVMPQLIHEDGLQSILLSAAGDSFPVSVIGINGTARVIFSETPVDSLELVPWHH